MEVGQSVTPDSQFLYTVSDHGQIKLNISHFTLNSKQAKSEVL